jgi:hypothetical protein
MCASCVIRAAAREAGHFFAPLYQKFVRWRACRKHLEEAFHSPARIDDDAVAKLMFRHSKPKM